MPPSDIDRVWSELVDLRKKVDRLFIIVIVLAGLVGGSRLTEAVVAIAGVP